MEPNDRERVVNEWLDPALKRYGRAEPRPGLESRILATLRTEHLSQSRWVWRPALAAGLAVLLGALIFLARGRRVAPGISAGNHIAVKQDASAVPEIPANTAVSSRRAPQIAKRSLPPTGHARPAQSARVTEEAAPRLAQFPAPLPLSEQEKMLASYVRDWPEEAKLVAQARTQLLEQALLELEKRNHVTEHSQEFEQ